MTPTRRVAAAGLLFVTLRAVSAEIDDYERNDQIDFPSCAAPRILELAFDSQVSTTGITEALKYRDRGYAFQTLQEINSFNVRSSHLVAGTARIVRLRDIPLESPWWWTIYTDGKAEVFLQQLRVASNCSDGPTTDASLRTSQNVLQKALAQRDLFQVYALIRAGRELVKDPQSKLQADELEALVASILRLLLLSESEYANLVSLLPQDIPTGFTSIPTNALSSNYLPVRVVARDDTWLKVPGDGIPFRHFQDYGGRSFIKVYLRAPGMANEQLMAIWRQLYSQYGDQLHSSGIRERTPKGLESMLVRTFGIFLTDGSWRDSGWPEEVIIRMFKYEKPELDLQTSDFVGTLFYQYKMSRSALLKAPSTLGLRRTLDDDEQFYGFFGDVPDMRNSYSDSVTTMRANCIACHSELFYGLNTIFSFERNPDPASGIGDLGAEPRAQQLLDSADVIAFRKSLRWGSLSLIDKAK